jgi:hypothetical protein
LCPAVGEFRAQAFVSYAFRQVAEQRRWSWLIKRGQFIMPAVYNTGTVTVTRGSPTVTGSGTTFTAAMVDRQFRAAGNDTPIYTIQEVNSATELTIDQDWGGSTASGQSYEIYQAYVTPPDDFSAFQAVWDPANNWRLHLHRTQNELNIWDSQRSNDGDAYFVAALDYSTSKVGAVEPVLQVRGTGPDPALSDASSYTGPNNAIFTIEVTTGGTVGVAVFQWKKDSGAYTTGVTTATAPVQSLQDGVKIYWPAETYVLGDTFIIRTEALDSVGVPRYELWPHKKAEYVYPYLYEAEPTDLEDPGAVVPRNIRGDVLLEHALAACARWPGDEAKPNPYYDLRLAETHQGRANRMVMDLELADDETHMNDFTRIRDMDFAPYGDATWLQSHAL